MRARWVRLVEGLSLAGFAALILPLCYRIADDIESWLDATGAALAAAAGLLAADFASGFVHWFCDTFFEEDTPVIGPLLIFPFRDHHRDPAAMTHHGFVELTGNSSLALVPLLATVYALPLPLHANVIALSFVLAMFATNLFHKWAHQQNVPASILRLQRLGLILTPDHHARHHRRDNREAYCVTTGWVNRFTDSFGLFRLLERAFVACGLPAARALSPSAAGSPPACSRTGFRRYSPRRV